MRTGIWAGGILLNDDIDNILGKDAHNIDSLNQQNYPSVNRCIQIDNLTCNMPFIVPGIYSQ